MKCITSLMLMCLLTGIYPILFANTNDNLMAHFPFNGNANDESGNENNGSVNGALLTTDRFGNTNGAYYFDGIDDFIRIQHSASLIINQQITLSCWIKKNSTAACYEDVFMKGNDSFGIQFSCDGKGTPMMHLTGNGWRNLNSGFVPENNKWFHIIGTYDGNTQKVYINGQLMGTEIWTNTIQSNTMALDIGYKVAADNAFFNGWVDDIRIYNIALSETEIMEIYNSEKTNEEENTNPGLVAFYPFNGNTNDESGNGHHATPVGVTLTKDRFGEANKAYQFSGSNQYINAGNFIKAENIKTITAWIIVDDYSITQEIVSKSTLGRGIELLFIQGYVGMYTMDEVDNNYALYSANKLEGWTFIAGTHNGPKSDMKFYINGELVAWNTTPNSIADAENLLIGMWNYWDLNRYFAGKIDDVGIYNIPLSSEEISALYEQSKPVSVNDFEKNSELFFPNPTNHTLYFKNLQGYPGATIKIFRTDGTEILSKSMDQSDYSIDISHFQSGTYFLKLMAKNQALTQKILKF